MKPKINNTKKIEEFISMWKLHNRFLNDHWVKEKKKCKREFKKYLKTNKNEKTTFQILWDPGEKSIKREVYS